MAYFHTTVLDEQIKALPTVDTASGSIATFDTDMTENLVEVKCQIVAQQSGSGTPSPSNPRPIQTYDSLTLYHNDINMWDEQMQGGSINTSTGVVTINPSSTTKINISKLYVKPNTQFNMHKENNVQFFICFYNANDEVIQYVVATGDTGSAYNKSCLCAANAQNTVFTTPPDTAYIYFRMDLAGATPTNISINYPSTDTEYHAFNGAYIPFGQTVANGLLNVGTGKLRVTHGYVETTWGNFVNKTVLTNYTRGALNITSLGIGINNNPSDICNVAPFKANYSSDDCHFYVAVSGSFTNANVFLPNDTSNDTVIQIVYELATPYDIQLDSITLQALLENNIWCDTGDTEVKYLLSVGKAIS